MGNVHRDSLDIIFRRISPEALKDALIQSIASGREPEISVSHIGLKVFEKYSHQNFTESTADEIENIYHSIVEKMYAGGVEQNIFNLLIRFSKKVLDIEKGDPVCDKEFILRWRDITLRLDQDLFTTSFLAEKDCKYERRRTYFAWPPVIRSNSAGIRELMKHGLSENHSHLNGAVPVFQLTWLSLMNHPNQAFVFDRDMKKSSRFEVNLEPAFMQSHDDYQMSWPERIQLAAWIRVKLFLHLTGCDGSEDERAEQCRKKSERENYSDGDYRKPEEQKLSERIEERCKKKKRRCLKTWKSFFLTVEAGMSRFAIW